MRERSFGTKLAAGFGLVVGLTLLSGWISISSICGLPLMVAAMASSSRFKLSGRL